MSETCVLDGRHHGEKPIRMRSRHVDDLTGKDASVKAWAWTMAHRGIKRLYGQTLVRSEACLLDITNGLSISIASYNYR